MSRSPHGVGMNDFDLLKVLGTGGDCQPIYCLLLYFYGFGESYSGLFCSNIQSIVTYICSVWESLPCAEDPWSRPRPPLCHEGSSSHHFDHHDYHRHHHCATFMSRRFVKISFSRRFRILISAQVLKKANIVQKKKTTEHTRTERQVF